MFISSPKNVTVCVFFLLTAADVFPNTEDNDTVVF